MVVADAQLLCRIGLCQLLEDSDEIQVVAQAENREQLLEEVQKHDCDVVVLDYNQPKFFDHHVVKDIKEASPSTEILVISSDDRRQRIYQVLQNGVNSFITKQCGRKEIVDAISATARGEKFYCSKILDLIVQKSFPTKKQEGINQLTPREREILTLVAKGKVAKEIAGELNISPHTIYTHRKNILGKLNLTSPMEMIVYALEHGLIELDG